MNIKEMQKNAYETAVKRGCLSTRSSMYKKIKIQLDAIRNKLVEFDIALKGFACNYESESSVYKEKIKVENYANYCMTIEDCYKDVYEKKCKDGISGELADVVISCMTMAELVGVDLETAIKAKMMYNEARND